MNQKRVFLSPAYLTVLERGMGLYGLYRNVEVEEPGKDGKPVREKLRAIGPIGVFREAREGERIDLRTVHPENGKELRLVRA